MGSCVSTITGLKDYQHKPITPEDIVNILEARNWQATIEIASSVRDIVPVEPTGILKCIDGRASNNKALKGPKMPGGIYSIAQNRGVTTIEGLKEIAKEVSDVGYAPSVASGDEGFFKVWLAGKKKDRPEYHAYQGAAAIEEAGYFVEVHKGEHAEKMTVINLVEGKTLDPKENDQRFVVDVWAAGKFGLDLPKFVEAAAKTVEAMGGPKKAKLIVPNENFERINSIYKPTGKSLGPLAPSGNKAASPSSQSSGKKPSSPSSQSSGKKPSSPSSQTSGKKASSPSSQTSSKK